MSAAERNSPHADLPLGSEASTSMNKSNSQYWQFASWGRTALFTCQQHINESSSQHFKILGRGCDHLAEAERVLQGKPVLIMRIQQQTSTSTQLSRTSSAISISPTRCCAPRETSIIRTHFAEYCAPFPPFLGTCNRRDRIACHQRNFLWCGHCMRRTNRRPLNLNRLKVAEYIRWLCFEKRWLQMHIS